MSEKKIILYDSPEAARYEKDLKVSGWVSSRGRYCGDDEGIARYDGCTHRTCETCGTAFEKHSHCYSCHDKAHREKMQKQYDALMPVDWDEDCPAYSLVADEWFNDGGDIVDHCIDNECDAASLLLVVGVPVYPAEVDPYQLYERKLTSLEDDDAIPTPVELLFEELNDKLKALKVPLCYTSNGAVHSVKCEEIQQDIDKWKREELEEEKTQW